MEFGKTNSLTIVRRNFRQHNQLNSNKVPSLSAFQRAISRFKQYPTLTPVRGKSISVQVNIDKVKERFNANPRGSIRQAVNVLNLSYGTILRILRVELMWSASHVKSVQHLSPLNEQQRRRACQLTSSLSRSMVMYIMLFSRM